MLAAGPSLVNVQTSGARPPANTALHLAAKAGRDDMSIDVNHQLIAATPAASLNISRDTGCQPEF